MIEAAKLIAVSLMVFYAGINLGFGSVYESQVNEVMLQAACFDLLSDLRNFNLHNQFDSGLISPQPEQKKPDELLIIDNSFSPGSPFVAIDDSILSLTDSTDLTGLLDSSKVKGTDSLKTKVKVNQDSLRLVQMALDSTARLQYFRYQREDVPYTTLKQKKKSNFFVEPSATYKTTKVTIDSTGKFVEIKELIAGKPSKIILRMPIEEYVATRLEVEERKKWESLGYAYELKNTQLGLSDLMKSLTDFEIPLPSVGVLSIFGTPKISLKIGGSVQIHGAWRSETTEGVTASRLGNTKNEPDFKQQVQINVNGTIGDKLNIVADWNTERTFEYENQLKIKYTGYEDEIIQSIEAGNVSLQTSPLVGGSEALFGIKAQFKMGPFSLTTIASQKKGETKEVQVSGGTSETPFQKRAYEYSTNHYFIDTIYASKSEKIFANYYGKSTPEVRSDLQVMDIQVWKSINQISTDKSKERYANAYINLDPVKVGLGETYQESLRDTLTSTEPGVTAAARFTLLTPDVDYILHAETGFITFKTAVNEQEIIAVAYRQEAGAGPSDDNFFGEFLAPGDTTTDKRLILKMIKPGNLQPAFKIAWSLMLKNIYALGPRNIKPEGFEFDIKREIEGQEPTSELGTTRFLNAFGLDLLNSSMVPPSDNIFDYRPGITILPETGEVIFPNLEPFSDDLPPSLDYNEYNFDEVYDTTKTFAGNKKIKDKWILVGKSKGSSTSIYQLGFNVVENSVKVLLNGRELSSGSDYVVDYNIGQLTIRNDAALVPGADLRITYEQNDLFQLASKTLLGARGIYEFSKKTKLGFSILNLNQQTLSDKVRIGEEPLSNSIYGLDFTTSAELPVVTKLLDNIFSTREVSTFNLSAEYAYIDPDPNTKKSTIVSDGGKSIAYIDDFEGAKKTIPIGVAYTAWKDASPPDSLIFNPGLNKQERMDHKGKSFWFTVTPANVTVQQIYGEKKKVATADQQVTVMDYVFIPDTAGSFNYDPQLQERNKSWGGIQKILSSTANDLIEENIGYVEFWAKIWNAPSDAKIYIDLGKISEDVIPNNKLDTEDKDFNDAIDSEGKEDTGLDGILDVDERLINPNNPVNDPSGDNFFFQNNPTNYPYSYYSINGTQGNAILTDIGRLPDTEDLNRNGNLDLNNSYYRYEIPLDTNAATNPFIETGGFNPAYSWYLYRIPLKEFSSTVGAPSFSDVESIRMFVQGVDSMVHFQITEFNLVGNQWLKNLPDSIENTDSVLTLSVTSIEENDAYTSPPGVFQERDRTRPDEDILRNEQSLSLILNGLEDGDKREAVKYLFRPLDVFNYKQMKLFIHGDENNIPGSISYSDVMGGTYKYSAEVYFRFGGDTNNYYEYRQPVLPGWNEISINFDELTALKQARGDSNLTIPFKQAVSGAPPGHFYIIKGNPTLTTVKFLSVGVYNINPEEAIYIGVDGERYGRGPLSGEVWINELRVVGADDSPGWAYSLSTSVKLADFATVSFNMSEKDPYFHRLSDRFGSRVEQRNWSVSTDVNLLKIIPINLPESNLRLNYSHTESIGKPLYIPGSDVKVDAAVETQKIKFENDTTGTEKSPELLREETETESISDSWSASGIKIKIPTKWWLIRDTFNALTMGFNYNSAFSRGPTVLSNKSWIWNANLNYGLSLSPDYYFNPIDIPVIGLFFGLFKDYSGTKIYFTPQNFSIAVTAKRNAATNITRARNNSPSSEVSSRDFTTSRGFNFTWKLTEGGFLNLTTSYALNISSSLAYLETYGDSAATPRPESDIWNDIFNGAGFGRDNRYQQNFDIRTAPKLPSLLDINKYFTLTASYGVSYQWNYDFRQEIVGRSAGFSNKATIGLTMRWKSLFDPFFKEDVPKNNLVGKEIILNKEPEKPQYDSLGNLIAVVDSAAMMDSLLIDANKPSMISRAFGFLVAAAKYVFLDYEMISFNFSNDNTLSKSGLKAEGTGFRNFWGLFYDENAGPTRGFMLGISGDAGPRAVSGNTNLSDVYSQKNSFDFKTSRPLWEGAKIDINWKSGWSVNKNSTIQVQDDGSVFVSSVTSTGTLNRSFLTIPPVLFLKVFNSGINQVAELYNPADPNSNLSQAFIDGFESIPFLANLGFLEEFANYIPRANWRITWDGLEKLPFLKSLADRISLDHSYSSTYTEGWKLSREGDEEIQVQKIEYGFAPLLGLNLTFGQLWGGNLTGNLKYSTRSAFDLGITTSNITENFSKDIGFTLQFSKSGFELPLFGVSLKNDIEFSLAYSSTRSASIRYDMNKFTEEGTPQDGTTRVTIEPRIKYTISAKVTLSIFYKRSTVEPEGASRIPPTTTNEAGLDVNISIN